MALVCLPYEAARIYVQLLIDRHRNLGKCVSSLDNREPPRSSWQLGNYRSLDMYGICRFMTAELANWLEKNRT